MSVMVLWLFIKEMRAKNAIVDHDSTRFNHTHSYEKKLLK